MSFRLCIMIRLIIIIGFVDLLIYMFRFVVVVIYDLYDFNQEKLYEKPNQNIDAPLGKFEELKAVEDAVRYMKKGEQATLLVPSVLAFGTYGDDEKIPNDMPLIIKIKIL